MTEESCQIFTGELVGKCFYVEIISQNSLRGSLVFAAEVSLVRCFVSGGIHTLSGD